LTQQLGDLLWHLTTGEKKGFMDDGVMGKRWDGELDNVSVSDLTLLFGTSAQLWELPHSRSFTEDKSVLTW
jgi:hypothetical protein